MKQFTVLIVMDSNDYDVYDDQVQADVATKVESLDGVKSAQVIGVGEGPDPEEA